MAHFDYPFMFSNTGKHAKEVVQDSIDDVTNCVQAILSTELGFRSDQLDFGIPDQVFELQPLNLENLIQVVENQEPRVQLLLEQLPDIRDPLIDRVSASVALRKATGA